MIKVVFNLAIAYRVYIEGQDKTHRLLQQEGAWLLLNAWKLYVIYFAFYGIKALLTGIIMCCCNANPLNDKITLRILLWVIDILFSLGVSIFCLLGLFERKNLKNNLNPKQLQIVEPYLTTLLLCDIFSFTVLLCVIGQMCAFKEDYYAEIRNQEKQAA